MFSSRLCALSSWVRCVPRSSRRGHRQLPLGRRRMWLQSLENRLAPAVTWINPAGGDGTGTVVFGNTGSTARRRLRQALPALDLDSERPPVATAEALRIVAPRLSWPPLQKKSVTNRTRSRPWRVGEDGPPPRAVTLAAGAAQVRCLDPPSVAEGGPVRRGRRRGRLLSPTGKCLRAFRTDLLAGGYYHG
jgi:hypothetical protein